MCARKQAVWLAINQIVGTVPSILKFLVWQSRMTLALKGPNGRTACTFYTLAVPGYGSEMTCSLACPL